MVISRPDRLAADGPDKRRLLIGSLAAYAVFCGLGLISRFLPASFLAFGAFGLVFPLAWAAATRDWAAIGFTGRGRASALLWGAGVGVLWLLYGYVAFRADSPAQPSWLLAVQVGVAFPVWLLILSPAQEFFFRGWLQPRLEAVLGRWPGLLAATLAFTLWHFFPPLEGTVTSTLPLSSPLGVASTVVLGLTLGYVYQRTRNILAPWLAHAIAGIGLVLGGTMTFVQYR